MTAASMPSMSEPEYASASSGTVKKNGSGSA
jgi:hypothetical protein